MKLEDLMVSHFRVEKVRGKMVAIADTDGNYLAPVARVLKR